MPVSRASSADDPAVRGGKPSADAANQSRGRTGRSLLGKLNPFSYLPKMGARVHIAIGLSSFVSSVVLLALFLGLIPDRENARMQTRVVLSESVATLGSVLLRAGDISGLRSSLEFVIEQNVDIHLIELQRRSGGAIVFESQRPLPEGISAEQLITDDVMVPLMQRGREWGTLVFRFMSTDNQPWHIRYRESPLFLIAFISLCSFPLFYLFLGKMLKELNPSEAVPSRVRSALDTIAEALLVLDARGNIVLANSAFAQLTGKESESLLGLSASVLPWQSDELQEGHVWDASLFEAKTTRHEKIGFTDASGQIRIFIVNCSPVFAANDKVGGVLISMDDVTQLEEQEILLRESMKVAEEASQAKSAFLSNMSHEIRTPMTAILGFTEVMKRNNRTSESERLGYLNTIANSGQHLLELINDVLDLSKVESGAMEVEELPCDCASIAQDVVRVLQSKADEKSIKLEVQILSDFPEEIVADPSRLRQVITNLVGNAIKFTDQGAVLVQLSFIAADDPAQARIRIDVVDSGIGMNEEQQARIFEAFTQASASISRRFGGTGLGLSISRQLTEAMNGTLEVSSEEGVGSTFHVELPVAQESCTLLSPETIMAALERVDVPTQVTWDLPESRILVVDDGPENRQLMSVILTGLKLHVTVAENGKEGLDMAVAAMQSEPFDLIFMDIQMPVMDGYEAVSEMRKAGVELPVVALTANAMKGFEKDILEAGFSHYMVKPIDMNLLGDLLARQLGGVRRVVEVESELETSVVTDQTVNNASVSDNSADSVEMEAEQDDFEGVEPVYSTLPVQIPDFYEVVEQFIQRVQEEHLRLSMAIEQNDGETVAQIAHWLRGSGGNVGYAGFAELCNEIESCAHGDMSQLPPLVEQLQAFTRQVLAGWQVTPRPSAAG